jgi:hypothetical protein
MAQTTGGLLDALLVPFLIALSIGAIVIVVWLVRTSSRTKTDAAAKSPPGTSGPSPAADHRAPSVLPERPASERSVSEPPYVVGLRSDPAGRWVIDIAGKPYGTLDAVPDSATRDQVVAALRALADFSRGYLQKARSGVAAAPPPAVVSPAQADVLRPTVPGATMPIIDLAKEIGDIVEEMLERSPALHRHAIRLQNVPGQGIAFVVDGVRYGELGDIPDPAVQTLIREATKEWERR